MKAVAERLPLLPLRDVVVYPNTLLPLLVGRQASVNAIRTAMDRNRLVFATAQRRPDVAEPGMKDLYREGCVLRIQQLLRLPDDTLRILGEGVARARLLELRERDGITVAKIVRFGAQAAPKTVESVARLRSLLAQFEEYVKLNRKLSDEAVTAAASVQELDRLVDMVASQILVPVATKQTVLASESLAERYELLTGILSGELEILRLERKIEGQVRNQVQKNQREFYLNEQLKAIKRELGRDPESGAELEDLLKSVTSAKMPKAAESKAISELDRLRKMPPLSPEATVIRNYVETLVDLPWKRETKDQLDVGLVQRVLDEDHFGLEKVKERIVELVAVIKLSGGIRGPILCLVGPPGVGKTSLGRSIARAMGRKFVRASLGGVRDEAEIRGHRRTYIGSMPGRIIQGMRKAGVRNPVFLLDEVDKMTMDYHGDPSSALLEVLDPEQNHTFNDHYVDLDFDLSRALFVTTANSTHAIPPPLLDRMEVIRLPGYLLTEKVQIARGFLVPQQAEAHGFARDGVRVTGAALRLMIERYTRESGVRSLDREIAKIMRKTAREVAHKGTPPASTVVDARQIPRLLGVPRHMRKRMEQRDSVGVAAGLAWTGSGGDVLNIEATTLPGTGRLILTGSLGDVMQESAQAALSYARARADLLRLDRDFARTLDIHIHIPEGATPKDGPSAGISMGTSLVSALTGLPVRRDVAMTGEITLRGNVLPIGGLNEKLVAAHSAGYAMVILPKENEQDLAEAPAEVKRALELRFVETMDEVLEISLTGEGRAALPFFQRRAATVAPAPEPAATVDPLPVPVDEPLPLALPPKPDPSRPHPGPGFAH